jgi:hypothetical protein
VQRLAALAFFLGGVLFFVIGDPVLVPGCGTAPSAAT